MSEHEVTSDRRRFLLSTTAAAIAAGSVGSLAGCGGGTPPVDGGTDSGGAFVCTSGNADPMGSVIDSTLTVADVPVGTSVHPGGPSSTVPFILARDAEGLYAYSNLCTHEGCPVPPPGADGISVCSCNHGSTFNANGDLRTPATLRPSAAAQRCLPHYPLTFMGTGPTARIMVNTAMVEVRTTRTMPPA